MKISIITAVYNRVNTIQRAILSVQSQVDTDLEHIVIDGGSTDGSVQLIESCRDSRTIFVSEPDEGIYDAINKGIRRSSGEIIGLMHSDDSYAHPAVLKRVLSFFNEGVDAIYGDALYFHPERPHKSVRRYRANRFRPETIAWGWMPNHVALFFRRNVFQKYGLYRTDYRIAADFEFIARVFHSGNIKMRYLPEVLVHMSTGGASTAGWRSNLLLNREVMRACRENGIRTNWPMILSKYPLKLLEFVRK